MTTHERSAGLSSSLSQMVRRGAPVIAAATVVSSLTVTPVFAQEESTIAEVVVTARKRAESLQDVPIAISVMQGAELEARGYTRVKDLQAALPNVSLADSASANSNTTLVIRGISSNARNAGFESGVSLYVDGVYLGRPVSFNQDFVDIERIEVLRGPQGTLFGKNTIAGAVQIATAKPAHEFGGKAAIEYGNFDYINGFATLNVPLGEEVAARASVFGRQRDGVVRNLFDGRDYNDEGSEGGRLQLRWQPGDAATLDFSADYLDEDRSHVFPETLNDPAAPGVRTTINDFEPHETRRLWGVSATGAFDLPADLTLTSISAYRRNTSAIANDNDNTPADVLVADFANEQRQLTQELRLVSPGGKRFNYVIGLFYFKQDAEQDNRGIFGENFPLTGGADVAINSLGEVNTTSYAAYADVQFGLTEKLQLLAGLRYTREEKDLLYAQTGELLPGAIFEALAPMRDSFSDNDVSPQLGLAFKATDSVNLYLKAARGYKSGGWNADFLGSALVTAAESSGNNRLDPTDFDFAAERATTYEAGMKVDAANGRIVTNLAVFDTDYEDLQVSQFLGVLNGGTVITNAGEARSRGVELELSAYPAQALRIDATVGYLDAEFRDYANCSAGVDCTGKRLPDAPRWSASGGIEYSIPVRSYTLTLRGDYSYRASSFTTPTNVSRLSTDSYGVANAMLSLHPAETGFGASLWVRNLTDKDYLTGAVNDDLLGSGRTFVGYGLPRTYGVRLQYSF